jgi:uncharacterized membrane protein YbhN (UPF0104 family)
MSTKRQVLGALLGAVSLFVGAFFGMGALFNIGTNDPEATLPLFTQTNYSAVAKFGAASIALSVGGLAAAAWISGGRRPLRATVVAVGVYVFGLVLAILTWIGLDVLSTLIALGVAVTLEGPASPSVPDGHEV